MRVKPPETRFQASSAATDTNMTPRAILALWSRFSHLYGNRFEVSYGPALTETGELQPVAATWAKALAGFTGDDLARGLHGCLDRNDGWPPSLPEFRALCREPIPAPIPLCHRVFPKMLPEPDSVKAARKDHARAALGGLKLMLTGVRAA
jgi:hypothetical protein